MQIAVLLTRTKQMSYRTRLKSDTFSKTKVHTPRLSSPEKSIVPLSISSQNRYSTIWEPDSSRSRLQLALSYLRGTEHLSRLVGRCSYAMRKFSYRTLNAIPTVAVPAQRLWTGRLKISLIDTPNVKIVKPQ